MATEDARKLFVAGLPESITEEVLRQLFEAAGGTVVDVSLPRDRATGRLRGFGFVTLSSSEEAEAVRGSLDGSMQSGRSISVRPFKSEPSKRGESRDGPSPQPQTGGDRTVYVGNLPYDVSQQEVEQLFAENEAGPVVRVHLPSGPDGRPRGFGFVTLGDAEAANTAVAALRDAVVRGRRLVVNIAHPRGAGGGSGGAGTPRPPREQSVDREPRPRYPSEPDVGTMGGILESARPVEGRRARGVEGKRKKTKTVKKKSERGSSKRGRGGGGSWQKWEDWDDD